jgi:hypothetical protein
VTLDAALLDRAHAALATAMQTPGHEGWIHYHAAHGWPRDLLLATCPAGWCCCSRRRPSSSCSGRSDARSRGRRSTTPHPASRPTRRSTGNRAKQPGARTHDCRPPDARLSRGAPSSGGTTQRRHSQNRRCIARRRVVALRRSRRPGSHSRQRTAGTPSRFPDRR